MTSLAKMSDAELRAIFDDPEFRAQADQRRADWAHMVGTFPELQREYPHEFIAIHRGTVVAHAAELHALDTELERLGFGPGEVLVRWVRLPTDLPLIL
jgi:hypothetical protein